MQLTAKDFSLIRELRDKFEILEDTVGHRLPCRAGIVSVQCSDCDRFPDMYTHTQKMIGKKCRSRRIHLIAVNGGPCCIPRKSPMVKPNSTLGDDLIDNIVLACRMKKIRTVALCGHAQCGLANYYHVSVANTIKLLVDAKRRIKSEVNCPGLKVACFFHVDYGSTPDGQTNMKTYFISSSKWLAYSFKHMP